MHSGGEQAKRTVQRFLAEVMNGANPDSTSELVADETLRRRVASLRTAFPDLQVTPQTLLAEGALVATHLRGHGTHEGLFQGCPPTWRRWSATCTAIYRVERGQIIEADVTWDWLAVLEQLGAVQRADTVSA